MVSSSARPPQRGDRRFRLRVTLLLPITVALLFAAGLLVAPAAARAAGPATLTADPVFSPNGDKVRDRLVVKVRLKRAAKLTVGVYTPDGKQVAALQKQAKVRVGTRTYVWNGRKSGVPFANGRYEIRAKVVAGSKAVTIRRPVLIDTVAPAVTLTADLEPTLFSGSGKKATIPYQVGERGVRLRLLVFRFQKGKGPAGKALTTAALGTARKLTGSAAWNGRTRQGTYLRTGMYAIVLRATDRAGNSGTSADLPVSLFAPTTVRGKVVDMKGHPVGRARVIALPTGLECATAANGSFVLRNCPLGRTVLKAGKRGEGIGGIGASIDLKPHVWAIVLGRGPHGQIIRSTADRPHGLQGPPGLRVPGPRGFWDDVGDAWDDAWDETQSWFDDVTIRMSGSFAYADKDGHGSTPMANVKIVLRDVWFDLVGGEWTRDIDEAETDAQGRFDFTYTIEWDDIDTPDVRVCALAEDKWGTEARVETPTFLGDVISCEGRLWNDNESNRLNTSYTDSDGAKRGAWRMIDAVRACRAAGFTRPQVLIVYPFSNPIKPNAAGGYKIDKIQITEGCEWGLTLYHEYGHAWLRSAYAAGEDIAGVDCNYYDAYWDEPNWVDTDEFWLRDGTFIGEKSDGQYTGFETQEEPWTAFNEGWAEFFAGLMAGCDYAGSTGELFECDRTYTDKDDNKVIHSVSRILWDLYDSSSSQLLRTWDMTYAPGPRLPSYYGAGDDDRVDGLVGSINIFDQVKWILDNRYPWDAWGLRTYLRERLAGNPAALRAIDAVYYRMGLTDGIMQNRPHVDAGTVLVDGTRNTDGSYRGTLRLWCRVTDPDSPNGDWDLTHVKVRFEGRCGNAGQAMSSWQPMSWTLTRSATPPPGQSGDDWFRVDFDTLAQSPVVLIPDFAAGVFTDNRFRTANSVTAATTGGTMRLSRYQVRAIAFDDLQESEPVESAEFAVDNGSGDFGGYGAADSTGDYIYWDDAHVLKNDLNTITWKPFTYEFRFNPTAIQIGTLAMYTLGYGNAPAGHQRIPIMKLEMLADGRLTFSINQYGGSPGGGTWHTITSATALQVNHAYHIAAEDGGDGMKLFVNGHLEASNAGYTGFPEADYSNGMLYDGWFSLGDYENWSSSDTTARGAYDEIRVSNVRRWASDFTSPASPYEADASTVLLDHLDGSTNGVTGGFTFGP